MKSAVFFMLAVAFVAGVSSDDPTYCRRVTPYTCITPIFNPQLVEMVSNLKDFNIVSASEMADNVVSTKIAGFDSFCTPFLASVTCPRANIWWECSRDLSAVANLINSLVSSIYPDFHMSPEQVRKLMRYAAQACNPTTGFQWMRQQFTCMRAASAKTPAASVAKLGEILSFTASFNQCPAAQSAVVDWMEQVDKECPAETADIVFRFVLASFTILDGYSEDACPINRTRSDDAPVTDEVVADATTTPAATVTGSGDAADETTTAEAVITTTASGPAWCRPKTSAAKYRCFAETLSSDLLQRIPSLAGLSPLSFVNIEEDQLDEHISTIKAFCAAYNKTVTCANQWWRCKADLASVLQIIHNLQDLLSGPGHESEHFAGDFIQRHFDFAESICAVQANLDTLKLGRVCIRAGLANAKGPTDRLSALLAQSTSFNVANNCQSAKDDAAAILAAVQASCQSDTSSAVKTMLSDAFLLIEGFSQDTCNVLATALS